MMANNSETTKNQDHEGPRITVRLTPEEKQRLQRDAKAASKDVSEYVRELIRLPSRQPTPSPSAEPSADNPDHDLALLLLRLFQRNANKIEITNEERQKIKELYSKFKK